MKPESSIDPTAPVRRREVPIYPPRVQAVVLALESGRAAAAQGEPEANVSDAVVEAECRRDWLRGVMESVPAGAGGLV